MAILQLGFLFTGISSLQLRQNITYIVAKCQFQSKITLFKGSGRSKQNPKTQKSLESTCFNNLNHLTRNNLFKVPSPLKVSCRKNAFSVCLVSQLIFVYCLETLDFWRLFHILNILRIRGSLSDGQESSSRFALNTWQGKTVDPHLGFLWIHSGMEKEGAIERLRLCSTSP